MINPLDLVVPFALPAVRLTSPSAPGQLLFRSMSVREELGRPFACELELYSRQDGIDLRSLLGEPMTVAMDLAPSGTRYWNGIVSRASYAGLKGEYNVYRVTLVPWLWLLTRNAGCKMYVPLRERDENGAVLRVRQQLTVPQVIMEVFRSHGLTDFEDALTGTYRPWDQVVKYRETDFNFVSRLMEQEGIYYYFKHEETKHTLVLSDSLSAHSTVPNYAIIPYFPPGENRRRDRDHIDQWSVGRQIQPGKVSLSDFDFERPRPRDLLRRNSVPQEHANALFEVYDYPGEYLTGADGDTYASVRMQELNAQHERTEGSGNARGLGTGGLFRLSGYPRDDQNRQYLVVSAHYIIKALAHGTAQGGGPEEVFRCHFSAIDSQVVFRPARSTPKPTVTGPQTAKIVGPAGHEIHTDVHGRVKIKFQWDQEEEEDENCSDWVRVAQIWAGAKFGGMFIPRMGQEVVVDFLEGDPDRPIITGRVYNGDNMPPYTLPGNMTQSGIKSRSTLEGVEANANEIRFEDKKDDEHFFMQAEKNMNVTVKSCQSIGVGADRSLSVGGKETHTVTKERELTINQQDTEKYNNGRDVFVKTLDKTIVDAADKTTQVGVNYHVSAGTEMKIGIGGAPGAHPNEFTLKAGELHVKTAQSHLDLVDPDATLQATGKVTITAGADGLKLVRNATDFISINAGEMVISCGGASITLKSGGIIELKGTQVKSDGGGSIVDVVAAGVTSTKGGSSVAVVADGVNVTGTTVKLNS